VYLERLRAGAVEEEGQKADGDVEDLTGYFVFMYLYLSAVGSSRTWRVYSQTTATPGGWESSLEGLDSYSSPSSSSCSLALATSGHSSCSQAM
jgi:hypothetical protein